MEVRYKSDASHNYMIIAKDTQNQRSSHEKMVIRNPIAGLLKLKLHFIDNEAFYYYEIQSRQSLVRLFENRELGRKEMMCLLNGIIAIFRELERYLLPSDEVLFDPEFIYLEPDTFEPAFVYYPCGTSSERGRRSKEDFACLAQFLIDHADKDDRECQRIAYDYYLAVEEGVYSPEGIIRAEPSAPKKENELPFTDPAEEKEETVLPQAEDYWEMEEDRSSLDYYLSDKKDETVGVEKPLRLALCCLGIIAVAAIAYLFLVCNPSMMPVTLNETEYLLAGCGIALLFGAALTGVIFTYNRRKVREENERQEKREEEISRVETDPMLQKEILRQEKEVYGMDNAEDGKTVLLNVRHRPDQGARLSGRIRGRDTDLAIDKSPYLIGKRNERVDGVIPDGSVSRVHASIMNRDGRYFLSDMNSTNGTFINGRRLELNETAVLEDGDEIGFANVTMTFQNRISYPAYGGS
ncbi:MAG: FHA domain-containing protein [Lachnospiraceae bacterium]|nr:FHA domain-containing protein [Lachnospiraceae bacterium]